MPGRKFKNGAGKPVIALDIDGTLGDYHGHFLRFAEAYIGKEMPDPGQLNPGLPLYKFMHVSRATYRAAKLAYRQGGLKRSMPAYEYAADLTKNIRRIGAEVWICTTRPYLRLDNIDPDTREWLRRNQIQYDAVLFGEGKYTELVRQVGIERVFAVADDLPEQIDKAVALGIRPVLMMDQPYNQPTEAEILVGKSRWSSGAVFRVECLEELWGELWAMFESMKEELQLNGIRRYS